VFKYIFAGNDIDVMLTNGENGTLSLFVCILLLLAIKLYPQNEVHGLLQIVLRRRTDELISRARLPDEQQTATSMAPSMTLNPVIAQFLPP